MKILLKGGRIVDPSQNLDGKMDLMIEDGRIVEIAKEIKKKASSELKIYELPGMIVAPGLIDMHVHLREPGYEYKETILTGCEAAVAGGFTSVACMPNTAPINDNRSITEFIIRKAAECGLANVYPLAAISKDSQGVNLAEFSEMKDAGAIGLSDDGKPVTNAALMRRALEYAHSLGLPVISHCEDTALSAGGLMNEGFVATELGLRGIPNSAEDVMVARDVILAGYTGTAVHICHVSTKGAAAIIGKAKKDGIKVTAETAPHYFTLSDEALRDYDVNLKVNPPLRTEEDRTAIRAALADGTIDVIATDHAPHARTDKEVEFEYAASGMIGLETSLALGLKLVAEGVLTISQLIEKMSVNPARILNLPKGTLTVGSDADITVFDPEKLWSVDTALFRSKSKNSPFQGWQMKGKALLTIVGGDVKYSEYED
ncbi:MAG: dihydroorotase [Smithellaceae bacterium]|nr:dihydroorotase [Smithellaceae bacterium]